jgi:FimV-like protein
MAFNLGWLSLRVGRASDAQRCFDLAARWQPGGSFGPAGLGLLAAERQQSEVAVEQLGRAVKSGSKNYYVHYLLGKLRLDAAKDADGSVAKLPAEKAGAIRVPLMQAVTLQPNCAPALNRLGFLEVIQSENPEQAERHLQAAANLEPDNCAYILMLARFQIAQGKRDQARGVLQEVAAQGSHPKCQVQARQMLAMLDRPAR